MAFGRTSGKTTNAHRGDDDGEGGGGAATYKPKDVEVGVGEKNERLGTPQDQKEEEKAIFNKDHLAANSGEGGGLGKGGMSMSEKQLRQKKKSEKRSLEQSVGISSMTRREEERAYGKSNQN